MARSISASRGVLPPCARSTDGASVSYDASPVPGLEHHIWMLDGAIDIEIDGTAFRVEKGDCVRYALAGASRFECRGRRPARYVIAMVHP
jgi:hypothetical protein